MNQTINYQDFNLTPITPVEVTLTRADPRLTPRLSPWALRKRQRSYEKWVRALVLTPLFFSAVIAHVSGAEQTTRILLSIATPWRLRALVNGARLLSLLVEFKKGKAIRPPTQLGSMAHCLSQICGMATLVPLPLGKARSYIVMLGLTGGRVAASLALFNQFKKGMVIRADHRIESVANCGRVVSQICGIATLASTFTAVSLGDARSYITTLGLTARGFTTGLILFNNSYYVARKGEIWIAALNYSFHVGRLLKARSYLLPANVQRLVRSLSLDSRFGLFVTGFGAASALVALKFSNAEKKISRPEWPGFQ
jgi:hypothetical protein